MSYYRKYRPQKFIELIGQDHIRQTLANALQAGSFSHAYLFSGPKGSGKTSTARLLAKALNCQGRTLGANSFEPCNKCISCKEIALGSSLDMAEIDAASNRGIDEMRELRDKIRFAPTSGRFKVYIIDECHMLTKEAFNALLKTLEEPPSHAIFILATTEMHKVPPTILSRTQSFEFKKADQAEMMKLLNYIVKKENLKIEPEALRLIARLSFGAYRDGLSMLDQVASLQVDDVHVISLSEVQAVLGQTAEGLAWEFAVLLTKNDRQKALKMVEKVYFEGKDLENFTAQVITIFRKAMLCLADLTSEFEVSYDEAEKLNAMTEILDLDRIVLIIEKLSAVMGKLKASILGQLPLEMAVVELTEGQQKFEARNPKPASPTGGSETILNIKTDEKKENKIEEQTSNVVEMKVSVSSVEDVTKIEPKLKSNPVIQKDPPPTASDSSFDKWPEVILEVKKQNNTLAALLGGAQVRDISDDQINLVVRFKFHADQICNKKNQGLIEAAFLKAAGISKRVDCLVDKDLEIKKPLGAEEEVLSNAKEVFEIE